MILLSQRIRWVSLAAVLAACAGACAAETPESEATQDDDEEPGTAESPICFEDDCCVKVAYYHDGDGDGYTASGATYFCPGDAPDDYVTPKTATDCNDNDASVHPNAVEVLGDGKESNCKLNEEVLQVTAGQLHTCALLDTGGVRCWGYNDAGQLGYGNTNDIGDNETPASAGNVNVGGIVTQIAAGNHHTCALLSTGKVRCWGDGFWGQLGYANTNDIGNNETPASAGDVNVGGTVIQITAGGYHTCALLSTGKVRCWGQAEYGRLGYGFPIGRVGDDETPASMGDVNVGGTVKQISAGQRHTCALLSTGTVRCWGQNVVGDLGYGVPNNGNTNNIGDDETPASAGDINVGGTVTQISAGGYHTCARLSTGAVRCWGDGLAGELGYGNTDSIGDDETPASAGNVPILTAVDAFGGAYVKQISLGGYFTCARLSTGKIRCWGAADYGQLGYGNTNDIGDDETPASAGSVNVGGTGTQVSAGGQHACALLSTGKVRCWGGGWVGQLGYGNTNYIGDDETPASAGDVNVF